jgi:hypothetical protein
VGICLAETGQLRAARQTFLDVLARDPSYAKARENLARLEALSGAKDAPDRRAAHPRAGR